MGSLGQINEYLKAVSDAINSQNGEYRLHYSVLYSTGGPINIWRPCPHQYKYVAKASATYKLMCSSSWYSSNLHSFTASKVFSAGCRTAVAHVKTLFRLDNPHVQQAIFSLSSTTPAQLNGACKRWLQQPWSDITSQHLQALQKRSNGMIAQAFSIYMGPDGPAKKALSALSENPQSDYMCSIMEQTVGNAEVLAREADAQLMLEGDSSKVRGEGEWLACNIAHTCLQLV